MKDLIIDVIVFSIIIVVIDGIYLKQIVSPFGDMIKKIQGREMNLNKSAAVVVYSSMVSLWYLFIYQDIDRYSFWRLIFRAFLLGNLTYTIFDFTNLAIIHGYRLDLALIDSLWGGILYAITTALFLLFKRFVKRL